MERILWERGIFLFVKPGTEKNLQAIMREDEKMKLFIV